MMQSVDWQPKLGKIGEIVEDVEDINQCIKIILTTIKGSIPHRPEFGSDIYKYIDYPVNEAIPNIIRETIDAINLWEQRIDISTVKAEISGENILIKISWCLKNSDEVGNIEITL